MSLTRSITRALTQPLTRAITSPGVGGGGAAPDPSTTTFNVTDNGGEPFAVSEGDFLVRI